MKYDPDYPEEEKDPLEEQLFPDLEETPEEDIDDDSEGEDIDDIL